MSVGRVCGKLPCNTFFMLNVHENSPKVNYGRKHDRESASPLTSLQALFYIFDMLGCALYVMAAPSYQTAQPPDAIEYFR